MALWMTTLAPGTGNPWGSVTEPDTVPAEPSDWGAEKAGPPPAIPATIQKMATSKWLRFCTKSSPDLVTTRGQVTMQEGLGRDRRKRTFRAVQEAVPRQHDVRPEPGAGRPQR